jgi:hypothetical protein
MITPTIDNKQIIMNALNDLGIIIIRLVSALKFKAIVTKTIKNDNK